MKMNDLLVPASYEEGNELTPDNWGKLEKGDFVMVQRDGEPLRVGEVDSRTRDASVFWVWLDGGRGRIAVYDDVGTCVWLPKGYRLGVAEEVEKTMCK